jgi:ATP synthase protein I
VILSLTDGAVSQETYSESGTSIGLCALDGCASVLLHMAPPREPSPWKGLAELTSIGMTMVVCTVIGLAGGYFGDRWLGTTPWLTLGGLLLGIVAGFVSLFRSVKGAERELDDRD